MRKKIQKLESAVDDLFLLITLTSEISRDVQNLFVNFFLKA